MISLQNIVNQLDIVITVMKTIMPFVFSIIGILYAIYFINLCIGNRLFILGIYPRSLFGLIGIFFAPFLHGNFNHLFFNSIPLFILLNFVLLNGVLTFYCVTAIIFVLHGTVVWLIGRRGLHIGASGVIMGYWSYLLFNAYYQGTVLAIGLGIVCVYYLGSLFFNLFPLEAKSSWEGHVSGFFAGIAASYLTPYVLLWLQNYPN